MSAPPEETWTQVAIDAAPDGILIVDDTGTILKANPAMEVLSGHAPQALVGQSVGIFLPPAMHEKHSHLIAQFFLQPVSRPMGLVRQLMLVRKDGLSTPIDIALGQCRVQDRCAVVVFIRDTTEVRRLQEDMQYQATHDTLTGLSNRWMFMQHFEQALQRARRNGRTLALLLLDLDQFKDVNDAHGHAAGDLVLVEVARRLRSCLRAGDVIARLGATNSPCSCRTSPVRSMHRRPRKSCSTT